MKSNTENREREAANEVIRRVAMLRPCNSPQYGLLSQQMLQQFLSMQLKQFSTQQNEQSGGASFENQEEEAEHLAIEVEVDDFDVQEKQEYPTIEALQSVYDGVVVMGSFSSAHEDEPWILKLIDFIQKISSIGASSENKKIIPVVGICFGHQIIARALGGKV